VTGTLLWTVPEASLSRATAALATCRSVRLRAEPRTHISVEPGATGCVVGSWDVVSLDTSPPTVLWQRPVSVCGRGADGPAYDFHLGPTVNVGALAVRFQGRVSLDCPANPDGAFDQVSFDARRPLPPVLEWGCWPGWSPQPASVTRAGVSRTGPRGPSPSPDPP